MKVDIQNMIIECIFRKDTILHDAAKCLSINVK